MVTMRVVQEPRRSAAAREKYGLSDATPGVKVGDIVSTTHSAPDPDNEYIINRPWGPINRAWGYIDAACLAPLEPELDRNPVREGETVIMVRVRDNETVTVGPSPLVRHGETRLVLVAGPGRVWVVANADGELFEDWHVQERISPPPEPLPSWATDPRVVALQVTYPDDNIVVCHLNPHDREATIAYWLHRPPAAHITVMGLVPQPTP